MFMEHLDCANIFTYMNAFKSYQVVPVLIILFFIDDKQKE